MNYLFIFFFIVLGLSIIITYLSIKINKNAIEVVNDMGIGWNLGNTFDCYSSKFEQIKTPDDQITLWGNKPPTRKMFLKIKKYGIKTIRIPVTWMHFMDKSGKVKEEWLSRVKEVVSWITKARMYCILNMHHDGSEGNWLAEGMNAKKRFDNLWTQIANEFKDFNEYLIFECMNDSIGNNFDYITTLIFSQSFIDKIRNSGGNNGNRLLIMPGISRDFDLSCSKAYKIPIDPAKKFAISIHYFNPSAFSIVKDDQPSDELEEYRIKPSTKWGDENDYKVMFTNFETLKEVYIKKGIPIVITETGVLTEQKKNPDSIRKYLKAEFIFSADYNGIMSCLWDNSQKKFGDINFYDREKNEWFDKEIGENFKIISKGKFVKPSIFFEPSNMEIIRTPTNEGHMNIKIGARENIFKVSFNVKITTDLYSVGFGLCSISSSGSWHGDSISGSLGERIYDGTYTFTFYASDYDFNNYIEIQKWWGKEYITFNYLRIDFKQNYNFFDYNEYIK
jgi:endoglucanase